MNLARCAQWLAGLWAGVLLCIALLAAPAAFATLAPADAGRLAGRMFAQEAYLSLLLVVLLFALERKQALGDAEAGNGSVFSTHIILLMGTLFCTVAGYFAVQPMMAAARVGQGPWSFAALHGASAGFFALKALLVCSLAWRLSARSAR